MRCRARSSRSLIGHHLVIAFNNGTDIRASTRAFSMGSLPAWLPLWPPLLVPRRWASHRAAELHERSGSMPNTFSIRLLPGRSVQWRNRSLRRRVSARAASNSSALPLAATSPAKMTRSMPPASLSRHASRTISLTMSDWPVVGGLCWWRSEM